MEILFIIFVALIFFVAFTAGSKSSGRGRRKADQSDFRTYFISLPEEAQLNFMDNLDELQRMQFEHMLEDEHFRYDEAMINEFNDWIRQEEDKNIAPYECFENSNSEYDSSYNGGYGEDYDNDSYSDYDSSDPWSSDDSSSISDSSGYSDTSPSTTSSDF